MFPPGIRTIFWMGSQEDGSDNPPKDQTWGTWDELLLACAVKRHGFHAWDSVSMEVQSRSSLPLPLTTADNCRLRYLHLKRRFSPDSDDAPPDKVVHIPWLEELRKLRVAELQQEVQRYDVSILSLQLKVKKLEEEREESLREKHPKPDLAEDSKGDRSVQDKRDADAGPESSAADRPAAKSAAAAGEESDRENRSVNESNSTGVKSERDKTGDEVEEEEEEEEDKKGDLEEEEKRRVLAKALLQAALAAPDEEDDDEETAVREEDQKSLAVGIIGAPNAGKSALTNYMVGTKVSAVSRKTNTTVHEVLGVMTKGDTQMCFFDTPGLTLTCSGFPHKDLKARVESAWSAVKLYDVLIVLFDVHRHLTRPDMRVTKLIERMGAQAHSGQKRVLCMNKIDLLEKKKDLLQVANQFKDLPGYDRYFMISGLKGSGVKDLSQYLMEQAVQRPWDEDPMEMSEEVMKSISLEVVREKLLNYIHQEIPYEIEHRLMGWKELRDGSLRIEQHLITHKQSQRKILVGKKGSKIGTIGIEANEELRSIFKRDVHLILQVRVK